MVASDAVVKTDGGALSVIVVIVRGGGGVANKRTCGVGVLSVLFLVLSELMVVKGC